MKHEGLIDLYTDSKGNDSSIGIIETKSENDDNVIENLIRNCVDTDLCLDDLITTLDVALSKDNYSAILLECTNMPPYTNIIQHKFNYLTIFNISSLRDSISDGYSAYFQKRK
mgnify:CR=1 FL=1